MVEEVVAEGILKTYAELVAFFPTYVQGFINIFLLVILIVVYSVLVWKFYRFIGKKNLIELNLNQYNQAKHPFFIKFLAGFLYLVEYIIILPFIVFIWFAGFASFLILLSNDLEIQTILFLSVTIISAIRMTSYIPKNGEEISKEIAKILPYTLLAVFVLNPSFFDFSRVLDHFGQLPTLFNNILLYVSFIFGLELILRIFDLIFKAMGLHDEKNEEAAVVNNQVVKK
jgi:membrane protein implicated in regulation of membrane protease activity